MKENLQYPLLVAFFLLLVTACEKRGEGLVKTDGLLSDSTTQQIEKIGDTENTDLQNFLEMERIIDEQKVYLNPMANIDMVMEQAGYSRRTSTKLIQQFASTNTRLDYLNQKRVEFAAHLLLSDRTLSSKEVGTRAGFYEDSTFRRNFKKYYGVTPTAYRAMHT